MTNARTVGYIVLSALFGIACICIACCIWGIERGLCGATIVALSVVGYARFFR